MKRRGVLPLELANSALRVWLAHETAKLYCKTTEEKVTEKVTLKLMCKFVGLLLNNECWEVAEG